MLLYVCFRTNEGCVVKYNDTYDNNLLFKQVADGDEKAYTKIFHYYTPRLYPYILKITKDEYIAKELLQETFLRLWAKRTELKKVQYPVPWLFKVAANICLMHLRTEANRNKLQGKLYEKMKPGEYAVAEVAEEKELENIIAKVVESLSPQKKVIYKLSRQEGLSHQEIADLLGLSINTVNNHLGLALRIIQEAIHKQAGLSLWIIAALFSV